MRELTIREQRSVSAGLGPVGAGIDAFLGAAWGATTAAASGASPKDIAKGVIAGAALAVGGTTAVGAGLATRVVG